MKLGSLFDGIGGFPLAASRHGIVPVWASEVDKNCIAVTQRHFPGMQHLGDITKINGADIEPVDVITFSSPCQDLSVAGRREGIEGERSGLFMDAIRIIRQMRHANNNRYPRFIVWENVPGAFSSNRGEDFRRVLSEVAEADIPIPANGKWANAGLVVLSDRQITWRVLDAQFWGVPQRRHRIFLVADFGGRCAAEILFDETRLSGTAQSGGKKEKGAAASFDEGYRVYDGRGRGDGKIASCITSDHDSRPSDYMHIVCAGFNGHKSTSASIQYASNRAPTIESNMPPNVAYAAFMAGQGAKAGGIGYSKDTAPTLKSTASGNLAPTLVMATAQANAEIIEGLSLTLNCAHEQPIVCWPPVCQTLTRRMDGGPSDKDMHNVIVDRYTLRRLMPIECERLQGFPDKWTEGHSDAARYHMIGNSVAVPCVDFIMQGIAATLEGDKSHEQ